MKTILVAFIACLFIANVALAARSREEMGVKSLQKKPLETQSPEAKPEAIPRQESQEKGVNPELEKSPVEKPEIDKTQLK